jgi:hypothetical protein
MRVCLSRSGTVRLISDVDSALKASSQTIVGKRHGGILVTVLLLIAAISAFGCSSQQETGTRESTTSTEPEQTNQQAKLAKPP